LDNTLPKVDFFCHFGGCIHTPCTYWCEILQDQADPLAPRLCQISRESVHREAPAGRKCWFSICE